MPLSRRALMTSLLASVLFPHPALALGGEPFPVRDLDVQDVDYKYRRREVDYPTAEPAGTIVVDPKRRFLFHVMGNGRAMRYGVAVGKAGMTWTGEAVIKRMAKWPIWVPTPYHLATIPSLIKHKTGMPGGPDNPMGARAMYLYQGEIDTVNRIHGAAKTTDVGRKVTAGCIGLLNVDVIYLYDRVQIGTRVVMLG